MGFQRGLARRMNRWLSRVVGELNLGLEEL